MNISFFTEKLVKLIHNVEVEMNKIAVSWHLASEFDL